MLASRLACVAVNPPGVDFLHAISKDATAITAYSKERLVKLQLRNLGRILVDCCGHRGFLGEYWDGRCGDN
jgi:hypothetical protein